jgi:hypothetical protein
MNRRVRWQFEIRSSQNLPLTSCPTSKLGVIYCIMVRHRFPVEAFFAGSPELRITGCPPNAGNTVHAALAWTQQHGGRGGEINCFMRPSCAEERDGHLARLKGVLRMHALLKELEQMGAKCTLHYHGMASFSFMKQ